MIPNQGNVCNYIGCLHQRTNTQNGGGHYVQFVHGMTVKLRFFCSEECIGRFYRSPKRNAMKFMYYVKTYRERLMMAREKRHEKFLRLAGEIAESLEG